MRLSNKFYKELDEVVFDQLGKARFDSDEAVPPTEELLLKHGVTEKELLRQAAKKVVDNRLRGQQDARQGTLPFAFDSFVSLGGKMYIRQGYMDANDIIQHIQIIDDNLVEVVVAAAAEKKKYNHALNVVMKLGQGAVIRDGLNEDGTEKKDAAE